MREYKREKALLEAQVADMTKHSIFHDDHLRIIDTWFSQVSRLTPCHRYGQADVQPKLLDEVKVIFSANLSPNSASETGI